MGREADIRIKNYERQNPRRLITYLFPAIWVVAFIARYEARASSWNLFQLIFWSVALLGVILFEYKRKKTYLHDLATLAELRRQHGADVSFKEENVAASEPVGTIKGRDEWRKLKPLIAFGIFLAAVFILPLIFHYFRVAFSK